MEIDIQKCADDLGIDAQTYGEILKDLLSTTKDSLAKLGELIGAGNMPEIASTAHSIKGATANMRIPEMPDFAKAIEMAAKESQDVSVIGENFVKLNSAFDALQKAV